MLHVLPTHYPAPDSCHAKRQSHACMRHRVVHTLQLYLVEQFMVATPSLMVIAVVSSRNHQLFDQAVQGRYQGVGWQDRSNWDCNATTNPHHPKKRSRCTVATSKKHTRCTVATVKAIELCFVCDSKNTHFGSPAFKGG
jgi:hypothetical protein